MRPEQFEVLRKVEKKPDITQRELAKELGLSLGKLNYCLKALRDKGLVKINNFKRNEKKERYCATNSFEDVKENLGLGVETLRQMCLKTKNIDEMHKIDKKVF